MLVVAAALVDRSGRVLVQRRPPGKAMAGLWEFPGGKVEPGETPEAALVRELTEELGIAVALQALEPVTFASAPLADRHLLLLLYLCRIWEGAPEALDATALAWHKPAALTRLAMPPADLPLIAALETALQS
jgi:8-oxo-dGTP diphosphatase